MQLRVLMFVGDASLRSRLQRLLRDADVFLRVPKSDEADWKSAEQILCDVLITQYGVIPSPAEEHVARLGNAPSAPAVIVMWDEDDPDELARLRAAGAEAALCVGTPDETLSQALCSIIEKRRAFLAKGVAARRSMPRPELSDFVSSSPAMKRFLKTVYRVADSDAPLLVTGETGVGKERLVRAIHGESRRSDGPFISVNCGAIPENLLESQLFGHEKGSFTGATKTQRGCFELAHGGTLFLDEISEMPVHLQVKLLHVLQDYEVAPIGSERRIPVDVRVIAATNRDIKEEVVAKRFRKDLFYRLSVVMLHVPPLRERVGDIPALAVSIAEGLSSRIGRSVSGIEKSAMDDLCAYSWPGNVRELINVLERAILLCEGARIAETDLPEEIRAPGSEPGIASIGADAVPDEWLSRPLKDVREAAVERFEKAYLCKLLAATGGRVGETAKRAGMEPRSLFNKMKRYGLRKEGFK